MAGASKKPRIRDAAATEEQQQPPRDHPARFLPDGVLEEVLARAAPRGLAACRCACRAWRAVVDARRLLRSDLLPLSVGGIFIGFRGHDLPPRFLARPSTTGRAIPRSHGCLPGMESISLSNDKYHVIKLPTSVNNNQYFRIGRSRKGVYFASLDPQCWLQVWRLKESRADEMEWVLIHYRDLKHMVPRRNDDQQVHRPWILQDEVYPNENKEVMSDEEIAWNSDDDNVLSNEDKVGEYGRRYMSVLGFHPYKEVVFLSESSKRVMAYHLNGSKVEYLGNLNPAEYDGTLYRRNPAGDPACCVVYPTIDRTSTSDQGRRDHEGMEQQEEDLTRLLPADALAEVLRRLPHRGLAVSRSVCKAWRSIIDARRLMLPHSLGGIFLRFTSFYTLQLLARPTTDDDPKIPAELGYLPESKPYECYPYGNSFDHCNGLLLLDNAVVNPATGKWAALPPHPPPTTESSDDFYKDKYLVFDPTVSMHYEVISIDRLDRPDPAAAASEWPPSPYTTHVFSSRTWRWEKRSFLREGEAAGIIADMGSLCPVIGKGYAVLWKGELYVQCESNFVMRISLSNNKYQVIKPPIGTEVFQGFCLGKSEKGVCYGLVDSSDNMCWLRVWILEELCGQMGWVLKHQTDLQHLLMHHKYDKQREGPWILQNTNFYERRRRSEYDNKEEIVQLYLGWDSNSDVIDQNEGMVDRFIGLLGFHPYKEVVFLTHSLRRGLAYDLNNSQVEHLGNMERRKQEAMETAELSALLPEDVLADVLRRLPPRGIATSRSVCKAWRALVDAHPLVRAELLPRSLAGILVNFHSLRMAEFFSRPSTDSHISIKHGGGYPWSAIQDHCNGLILIDLMIDEHLVVINPATRWFAHQPPNPPSHVDADSSK
uniref:F-box domain-containing protein n=1 Tax=Dichanthelium oligosanthes TaxID=888268 RepID=A0A1E5VY08_9POAL|nr:hypothetical protein BAE44_0008984 [Dichanthelium oligosanthes]